MLQHVQGRRFLAENGAGLGHLNLFEFGLATPRASILGGSFGLAIGVVSGHTTFAAVDDNTSQLKVWTLNEAPPSSGLVRALKPS